MFGEWLGRMETNGTVVLGVMGERQGSSRQIPLFLAIDLYHTMGGGSGSAEPSARASEAP